MNYHTSFIGVPVIKVLHYAHTLFATEVSQHMTGIPTGITLDVTGTENCRIRTIDGNQFELKGKLSVDINLTEDQVINLEAIRNVTPFSVQVV